MLLDYYVSQVRRGHQYALNQLITFRKDTRSGVSKLSFNNHEVNQIYRHIQESVQMENLDARFLTALTDGVLFVAKNVREVVQYAPTLRNFILVAFECQ